LLSSFAAGLTMTTISAAKIFGAANTANIKAPSAGVFMRRMRGMT
jgi:hypothetical protein